jgi:hypothetical protein
VALSEGDSLRTSPITISDGAGGAFVTWSDNAGPSFVVSGVVVQHLASNGSITSGWPAAGLLIKQDASVLPSPELFGDGAGGAIVVWLETSAEWFAQRLTAAGVRLWSPPTGKDLGVSGEWRFAGDGAGGLLATVTGSTAGFDSSNVIAQRFDNSGEQAWSPAGELVRSAPGQMSNVAVVADGSGGAIVAWADGPTGSSFAQRLDATGAVAPGWPADGAQVADSQGPGVVAADGAGGAFFAWLRFSGTGSLFDARAQHPPATEPGRRLAASGALVASGVVPSFPAAPTAISDGAGEEIVVWRDARSGGWGAISSRNGSMSRARDCGKRWRAISSEAQCQRAPALVSDGAGGATAFWMDKRSGGWDIYGKRVNAAGLPLGASAAISAAGDDQSNVQAVDDGAGGGVAAWFDYRNGVQGVEAQRLTSGGVPAWTPDGVDLVEGFGGVVPFGLAGDGAGGAIVTWPLSGVRAQHLDAGGTPLWGTDGLLLGPSTLTGQIDAVSDGAGGAIVVWWGLAFDPDSARGIYGYHAQRLNAAGALLWGADGMLLAPDLSGGFGQRVIGDGAGGVYLAWHQDDLFDGTGVIRVQHRDALGHRAAGWPEHGVVIASLADRKLLTTISSDGAGGVVVGWGDLRSGARWASYVQRVGTDATVKWLPEGVLLTTNSGDQLLSGIVSDGTGGAIALWMDGAGTSWDIRAQHVNDLGVTQWSAAGLAVHGARKPVSPAIVSDGAGGAVAAWQDDRAFPIDQIFMARIGAGGTLLWPSDGVVPVLASVVSAEVRAGVAHLEWQVASATHAQVERSDDGVAWSNRAMIDADGQGRIRFDDADVQPARRYGWRLAIPNAGGVARVGEAWLYISSGVIRPARTRTEPRRVHRAVAAGQRPREAGSSTSGVAWSREVGTLGVARCPLRRCARVSLARLTQGCGPRRRGREGEVTAALQRHP